MSGEKYPTLSLVMPIFIELFSYIENKVRMESEDIDIKVALSAAHSVLAKHFSFMDDSPFYLLSVLLDPRFKSAYLEMKGFDTDYLGLIQRSLSHLKKLVEQKRTMSGDQVSAPTPAFSSVSTNSGLFSSMFSHSSSSVECTDEVDKYLSIPCEAPQVDPIVFWKAHSKQFPFLSRVPKDILSIPGTSVSVERIFNCGRDTIGLRRHRLKLQTLTAIMFGKCYLKWNATYLTINSCWW